MIIRELLTLFGFDVDSKGANEAKSKYSAIKNIALSVAGAATLAAGALALMVSEAIHTGDQADKAGKRLRLTAEEVQELAYAAKASDVEFSELSNGLRTMRQRASEAAQGNKEMAKGFGRVGVSVRDANGKVKPTAELLSEIADALNKLPDDAARTAAAMKIFGGAGDELLPFLQEGSEGIGRLRGEARRLGFVLDAETVEKLVELGDVTADIGFIFKGLRLSLVKELLPTLLDAAGTFKELAIAIVPLIRVHLYRFGQIVRSTVEVLSRLAIWVVRNRRFFVALAAVVGSIAAVKVLALARALGILRLEFLKNALVFGFQFIVIGALIVLIALLVEDIYKGAKGLRKLRDYFVKEAQKPNANWMVKIVAWLLDGFVKLIDATDLFFKGFFEDAERMGGVWESLKNAGGVAIDYWAERLRAFMGNFQTGIRVLTNPLDELQKFIEDKKNQIIFETIGKEINGAKKATGKYYENRLPINSGGSTVNVQGPAVDITINTGPGADAGSIGKAAGAAVQTVVERWTTDIGREFEEGLAR